MCTHELPLPRHRLFVCWGKHPGRRLLNALALSLAGDMPVTSSHTSAFTHSPFLGCTKEGLLLGIYRSCDALPVPFFSTRALQCQRCEGHASARDTGSTSATTRRQGGCSPLPLPCMKTLRKQGADGSLSRQQHSGNLARAGAGFAQMHARRSQRELLPPGIVISWSGNANGREETRRHSFGHWLVRRHRAVRRF